MGHISLWGPQWGAAVSKSHPRGCWDQRCGESWWGWIPFPSPFLAPSVEVFMAVPCLCLWVHLSPRKYAVLKHHPCGQKMWLWETLLPTWKDWNVLRSILNTLTTDRPLAVSCSCPSLGSCKASPLSQLRPCVLTWKLFISFNPDGNPLVLLCSHPAPWGTVCQGKPGLKSCITERRREMLQVFRCSIQETDSFLI